MGLCAFQRLVRNMDGVWAGSDIYFVQTQSQYTASYLPAYPLKSEEDSTISGCWVKECGATGFINPSVYTIVAESTGTSATKWGELKIGAGRIPLDHAAKT